MGQPEGFNRGLDYEPIDMPLFTLGSNDFCSIAPNDIGQKMSGNCTLMATLIKIAQKEPQLIKDAIVERGEKSNADGVLVKEFAVNLYLPREPQEGKKVTVVVDLENNKIIVIDPFKYKDYSYSLEEFANNFDALASCDITKGADCPHEVILKSINSFLAMSLADQMILLSNKDIQWRNHMDQVLLVIDLNDDEFKTKELDMDYSDFYSYNDLEALNLTPIIAPNNLKKILSTNSFITWADASGNKYYFDSIKKNKLIFKGERELILTYDEFYFKFGVSKP